MSTSGIVVAVAPHRVSFFGGGTDLPDFYHKTYGAVLSLAIDKYVYVTVKDYGSFFKEQIRLNYSVTELLNDPSLIENDIIRETLALLQVSPPLYISTIADVPSGTGLGSSSSFAVALISALNAYQEGVPLEKGRVAELASQIEIERVGSPIGKQDQYAAAFGGINYVKFNEDDTVDVHPVRIAKDKAVSLFAHLQLYYTGGTRSANEILSDQKDCIDDRMGELVSMRDSAARVRDIMESPSFEVWQFGEALHEAWETKKKLTSKISNATIDAAYDAARAAGAYGGKLCGAGGSGFLLVCVAPEKQAGVEVALSSLGLQLMPFAPDYVGVRTSVLSCPEVGTFQAEG